MHIPYRSSLTHLPQIQHNRVSVWLFDNNEFRIEAFIIVRLLSNRLNLANHVFIRPLEQITLYYILSRPNSIAFIAPSQFVLGYYINFMLAL